MSQRERRMAVVVAIVGGALALWKFAVPAVHDRLFAIQRENERLQKERDELDRKLGDVEGARKIYREYIERTGYTNADEFKNAFYNKLTEMATKANFQNLRMQPSLPTEHKPAGSRRKSDIKEVRFTISASGTLEAIADFLRDFYELPYVAQITSLKLDAPSGRSRRSDAQAQLRATIEALVPPDHPVGKVNPALVEPVAFKIKHSERDFALIWERDPFKEWEEPQPVIPEPTPVVGLDPTPPPEPLPPVGDPLAGEKVIRMVMIYGDDETKVEELLVVNTRDLSWQYVGIGDELDGGTVELVHPWGAVARRKEGDERVYPIKLTLAESIPIEQAGQLYPEIHYAYEELKASRPIEAPVGVDGTSGDTEQQGPPQNPPATDPQQPPQVGGQAPADAPAEMPTEEAPTENAPEQSAPAQTGGSQDTGATNAGGQLPVYTKNADQPVVPPSVQPGAQPPTPPSTQPQVQPGAQPQVQPNAQPPVQPSARPQPGKLRVSSQRPTQPATQKRPQQGAGRAGALRPGPNPQAVPGQPATDSAQANFVGPPAPEKADPTQPQQPPAQPPQGEEAKPNEEAPPGQEAQPGEKAKPNTKEKQEKSEGDGQEEGLGLRSTDGALTDAGKIDAARSMVSLPAFRYSHNLTWSVRDFRRIAGGTA